MNRLLPWRIAAWALGITPLLFVVKWTVQSRLGANPVEFLEHYLGDWTLRLLLVTLAMTPLRMLTGINEPVRIRRLVGLWTFAYVCLHFLTYLTFDLEFSLAQFAEDLAKRIYITLGLSAWILLLPLAITSTAAWQRRLKRRWLTLHQLIYPAAILGAVHYLWLVKADTRAPLIYLAILLGLLAFRLPWREWANSFRQVTVKSS